MSNGKIVRIATDQLANERTYQPFLNELSTARQLNLNGKSGSFGSGVPEFVIRLSSFQSLAGDHKALADA